MVYPNLWKQAAARVVFGFWAWWHNQVHMRTLGWIPIRPVGLSNDGESFNDPTPQSCAERLEALRSEGYVVPQGVIDALRAEQPDEVTA
jgi:hypothetical protein